MTAKVVAVIAVALAFRGSYLQKKATTDEQKEYSLWVSIGACILSLTAYLLR